MTVRIIPDAEGGKDNRSPWVHQLQPGCMESERNQAGIGSGEGVHCQTFFLIFFFPVQQTTSGIAHHIK